MVVLFYHVSDGYATSETESRANYYNVSGIPHSRIDGTSQIVGGGNVKPLFENYINSHLNDEDYLGFDLSGSSIVQDGGTTTINLNVHIEVLQDLDPDDTFNRVRYAVYESGILGEEFMVRDLLPIDNFNLTTAGETVDYVKSEVFTGNNPANMGVVVFVQSQTSKHVLNACELSFMDVEINPETTSVPMGTDLEFTVDLQNITPYSQSFDAWIDVILPNGNEHPANPFIGPVSPTVPGDWSHSRDLLLSIPDGIPTTDYQLRIGVGDLDQPDHWEYDYMTFTVTE
jgi:hypothetical protein